MLFLKKFCVAPPSIVPYLISVCLAKSSADSIGDDMRSNVKKAARFAVYELIRISIKNHHKLATNLVDTDRGVRFVRCCINAAKQNHNEFKTLKSLLNFSDLFVCHSCIENRLITNRVKLTPTKVSRMHSQSSLDKGARKLNMLGFSMLDL